MRKLRFILTGGLVLLIALKIAHGRQLTVPHQQALQEILLISTLILTIWWLISIYRRFFSSKNATLRKIDRMDGIEFEHFCANLLKRGGFEKIQVTSPSHDQGIDIIAERDAETYGFQCKRYDHPVDNSAIQEVFTGCAFYQLTYPIVISNTTYTRSAQELAAGVGVELIDRDTLLKWTQTKSSH